jgi:CBS domain-containing protein
MTIARIMEGRPQEIISCAPQDSVREAARRLAENRIGCLPVLDGDSVLGMFSERDLLYCVASEGESVLERPVGEVMTAPAITVDRSLGVDEALALMTRRRIRHLPVVEHGRLTALVSIGDLVKYRMDEIQHEAEAMREYITQA